MKMVHENTEYGNWNRLLQTHLAPHHVRVAFTNLGGVTPRQPHRLHQLHNFITNFHISFLGIAEVNVNWDRVPAQQHIREQLKGHKGQFINISYIGDRSGTNNMYQSGGTATVCQPQWTSRKQAHGSDRHGRWNWIRFRTIGGTHVRVFTAYRPVHSKGAESNYQLLRQVSHNNTCPRDAFWDDLGHLLDEAQLENDLLLVMADVNQDVLTDEVTRHFSKWGLVNLHHHANSALLPTFARGSRPIDGMWGSRQLVTSKCGMVEAGTLLESGDHALLWLDIPAEQVFGQRLSHEPLHEPHRLNMNDPRVVHNFQQAVHTAYLEHNIYERIEQLASSVQHTLSPEQTQLVEEIDRIRVQVVLAAEATCRRLCLGWVPFTAEWQDICTRIQDIKTLIRASQLKPVSARRKRTSVRRLQLTWDEISEERLQEMLNSAYRDKRHYKKERDKKRVGFLEELAAARVEAAIKDQPLRDSSTLAERVTAELNSLLRREQQRKESRIYKRAMGLASVNRGLEYVIGPDPNTQGARIEITDKLSLEKCCLKENQSRFHQASHTPFLTDPLYGYVGPQGNYGGGAVILNGEAPEHIRNLANGFIPFLRRPANVPVTGSFKPIITEEMHQRYWRRARERTASGASGLQFPHFRAGALHPGICRVDTVLANIPFSTGYSLERWRTGLNVMIPKKSGNFNVEKLRTILLFEADCNQNNKHLGRMMMQSGESHQVLAPEQYGSRKHKSAIGHAVNKRMTYDILRQMRKTAVMCSNDAKGCYDRIVLSVAGICMQRCGAPAAPIQSMISTLQNMKQHIRTAHGISEYSIGSSTWDRPPHGVGQGNGAGPAIWAAVSTPALDMLRAGNHGTKFTNPITGDVMHFAAYSFVDDTDICETGQDDSRTPTQVLADMQTTMDKWEGAIRATGGALEPSKSKWYLISFLPTRSGSGWKYAPNTSIAGSLYALNPEGRREPLERLEPSTAIETLGVWLSPDGSNSAQVKKLRKAAREWADRVRTAQLPKTLIWEAIHQRLWKKLEYPLPALSLTLRECEQIMQPAIRAGLNAIGCARTFTRAYVFASHKYQGLGIPHLYWQQGIMHVLNLMRSWRPDDFTGQLTNISQDCTTLELGVPQWLLESYSRLGHLATPSLLTDTWKFCSEFGIRFWNSRAGPPNLRENDRPLMQILFQCTDISAQDLVSLNQCRLWLHIYSIADMTAGDGHTILHTVWNGQRRQMNTAIRDINWPPTAKPPARLWPLWRQTLSAHICISAKILKPRFRLGHWIEPQHPRAVRLGDSIWIRDRGAHRTFRQTNEHRRNHPLFVETDQPAAIPPNAYPIVLTEIGRHIVDAGRIPRRGRNTPPTASDIDTKLDRLPDSAQWAIRQRQQTGTWIPIQEAITDGSAIAVSDGSYKDGRATAAWTIRGHGATVSGHCLVPGRHQDQSAYRAELAGIYAIVLVIHTLGTAGSVTIACDGKSALRMAFQDHTPITKQYDLISAIHNLRQTKVAYKPQHVLGHQDEKSDRDLTMLERINVEMDHAAKAFWDETAHETISADVAIYGCPWVLQVDHVVSGNHNKILYDHISQQHLRHWLHSKDSSTAHDWDLIDWDAWHSCSKRMPQPRRIWLTKQVSGMAPTNLVMHRRGLRLSPACPRCAEPEETTTHVLECSGIRAMVQWEHSLAQLKEDLEDLRMATHIRNQLVHSLDEWKRNHRTNPHSPNLHPAIAAQARLGWVAFLEGRLSPLWRTACPDDLVHPTMITNWCGKLALAAITVAWDQWTDRNQAVHSGDTAKEFWKQQVQQQIDLGDKDFLPEDQHWLPQAAKVLRSASSHQAEWVQRVLAARRRATEASAIARSQVVHQRDRSTQQMRSTLRRFLNLNITRSGPTESHSQSNSRNRRSSYPQPRPAQDATSRTTHTSTRTRLRPVSPRRGITPRRTRASPSTSRQQDLMRRHFFTDHPT